MSDEAKRIVAEETWEAEGDGVIEVVPNDGDFVAHTCGDSWATIAACAPEALRMLLLTAPGDGGDCQWCDVADIGQGDVGHDDRCPWLALMRKAGLR